MIIEEAITFQCRGDELLGVLHRPATSRPTSGVLIVVGGPQYRVGSHRQFVLMARSFAAAGYTVFRFDYRGMGDSSGEPRTFEAVDDDLRAAVDVLMAAEPRLRGVVIFGLCDAASAALIYARGDPRIKGLALANPWVRTEAGEARALVQHYYGRRFLQRSFWAKVLAGKFNLRASVGSLSGLLRRLWSTKSEQRPDENAHFVARMRDGLAAFREPVLILISDRDLTAKEFESLVLQSPDWHELSARKSVKTAIVTAADHTFSSRESLAEATSICLGWFADDLGA